MTPRGGGVADKQENAVNRELIKRRQKDKEDAGAS